MAVTLVGSVGTGHNEQPASGGPWTATRNGVVAGNTLVVAVGIEDATTITSVSDGTTTLTVPDVALDWGTGTQRFALYSFPRQPGGNRTITVTPNANQTFRAVVILETTPSVFDGTSSTNTGTSAAPSSGNLTPTTDGCLIIGYAWGATALTSAGGFSDYFNDATDTADTETLAQATKAAVAATWTMTSGIWGALAAAYKPIVVAGGFTGSRGAPGQGPRDKRGFLKARVWDYTLMSAGPQTYNDTVAEILASTDSETAQADFVSARIEAGSAADSEIANALFVSAEAETLAVSDAETGVAGFAGNDTEVLSAADSETALANFVSSITETLAAADSIAVAATFISSIAESLSAADSETGLADFVSARVESLSVADTEDASVSSGGTTYNDSVAEALSALEAEVSTADFVSAAPESVTAAENVAVTADFISALTEALAAGDSSTGTTAATFDVAVNEVLSAADTSATDTAGLPRRAIYDETFDEVEPQVFNVQCSEQLEVRDEQVGYAVFPVAREEAVTVVDAHSATADFGAEAVEVVNLKASHAGWALFRGETHESVALRDDSDGNAIPKPSPPDPAPPEPEAELADDDLLAIVAAYQMLEAA